MAPRFFLYKEAPSGLFLSPGLSFPFGSVKFGKTLIVRFEKEIVELSGFVMRFIIGYTWVFGKTIGFVLSLRSRR